MTPDDARPFASRLSARFALILALALLPIGAISIIQTIALEAEVQARAEAGLLGATLRAAEPETGMIRRTQGLVATLAQAVPMVMDNQQACIDLMRRTAELEPAASLVAFLPVDGLMTCSSSGRAHDFSASALFAQVRDRAAPSFVVNREAPVSGTSVLGISHPVRDAAGHYLGYVTLSLPHTALRKLQLDDDLMIGGTADPLMFWTFDGKGTLLTSSIDMAATEGQFPAGDTLLQFTGKSRDVFQGQARNGRALTYAVVPILPDELYLMSAWDSGASGLVHRSRVSAYLPTMLMWLAGLAVSAFVGERLVTRHVRTLNRSIVNFARGDRRLQNIDMRGAPTELQELSEAYLSMTETITRGEAELEDSLHQKEVLLREVHHRVKNNLQLISSIMNIQIRAARTAEAKQLLKDLQERIMSLATVHRGLYQTSGLADVKARELFPDIVRQILSLSSGPEKPMDTSMDIDDLRLVPDQAVPLSLLVAEALTNAIKHSGASRRNPGTLLLRLKRSGGTDAVLEVVNSSRSPDEAVVAGGNTGLGTQLIKAFVQQVGGTLETERRDGEFHLRVTFTVTPLASAENRLVPVEPQDAAWN